MSWYNKDIKYTMGSLNSEITSRCEQPSGKPEGSDSTKKVPSFIPVSLDLVWYAQPLFPFCFYWWGFWIEPVHPKGPLFKVTKNLVFPNHDSFRENYLLLIPGHNKLLGFGSWPRRAWNAISLNWLKRICRCRSVHEARQAPGENLVTHWLWES